MGTSQVHEYALTIKEQHLDTFGHVNNATYLQLLEEARWEWITSGGYGLVKIAETGKGPTVLECTIKFKRELRNRQDIKIRSWVESYVGKVAQVTQEIVRERDGELCCKATFLMGFFDVGRRALIEPTEDWLACVGLSAADWQPKKP